MYMYSCRSNDKISIFREREGAEITHALIALCDFELLADILNVEYKCGFHNN